MQFSRKLRSSFCGFCPRRSGKKWVPNITMSNFVMVLGLRIVSETQLKMGLIYCLGFWSKLSSKRNKKIYIYIYMIQQFTHMTISENETWKSIQDFMLYAFGKANNQKEVWRNGIQSTRSNRVGEYT
jgi:hypothetical protein